MESELTPRQLYMKKYNKKYRENNPDYFKSWAKQDPEKQKEYRKTSYNRHKDKRNQESKDWRKKNLAYNSVRTAKLRCKRNGMEFNLDRKWAEERYTGRCELTDIPFQTEKQRSIFSISLDRIDNTKGYTKDNCRFILWGLNVFKGTDTDEDMLRISETLIYQYHTSIGGEIKMKDKEENMKITVEHSLVEKTWRLPVTDDYEGVLVDHPIDRWHFSAQFPDEPGAHLEAYAEWPHRPYFKDDEEAYKIACLNYTELPLVANAFFDKLQTYHITKEKT